ncbi:MAG: hypothetical protein ACO1QS_20095 [Verrucomicrobiota bacterium]
MFSLLLVLGQWTSAMPSASQRLADACDDCSCKMVSCCVAPASTPAPNQSSVPLPSTRVTEQQLVAALETTVTLLASLVPVTKVVGPVHTAEFSASAVPLYCWNCTFLI